MSYRDHLPAIIQGNKSSMRHAALSYREARRRGEVRFMITWLILAVGYRKLIRDFEEFQ